MAPWSICSIVSPMRSVSRAALARASASVARAPSSRCRGCATCPAAWDDSGNHFVTRAAMGSASEEDETHGERQVEEHVEVQHLPARVGVEVGDGLQDPREEKGKDDAAGDLEDEVAQGHAPSAAGGAEGREHGEQTAAPGSRPAPGTWPPARRSRSRRRGSPRAGPRRGSRPREDREEGADQHVEHRVARERAEEHLVPAAPTMGFAAAWMSCRARMMRPRPMATRPSCPALVFLRDRRRPRRRRWREGREPGEVQREHLRHERRADVRAQHDGEGGASAMRFCETKELVMSAGVALEDCTRLVTPRPAMKAEPREETLFDRTRRRPRRRRAGCPCARCACPTRAGPRWRGGLGASALRSVRGLRKARTAAG